MLSSPQLARAPRLRAGLREREAFRNWLRLKNSKKAAKNIQISNDAFFTSASSGAPPESWPEGEGGLRNWPRPINSEKAKTKIRIIERCFLHLSLFGRAA